MNLDCESLNNILRTNKVIAIYGSGVIAYNISRILIGFYGIKKIHYFVTNTEKNTGFGGIIAEKFSKDRLDSFGNPVMIVATPVQYHEEIKEILYCSKINNYILVDTDIEYYLMSQYFRNAGYMLLEDLKIKNKKMSHTTENKIEKKVEIYMAKSVHDKPLKKTHELMKWFIPVQAGKKLTNFSITELTDEMGESISERNNNYSELTVTYWAWKNSKADYKGICHYRRMLSITSEDIINMQESEVDVILPLPFLCAPNASEQYLRYVGQKDFDVFCQIIETINIKQAEEIGNVLKKDIIYNYNMVIAKKEIFDDYCDFLFNILFKMEQYYLSNGIFRNDRYLGYFGELLTSAYFTMNMKKFKIVHGKKVSLA